MSQKYFPLCTSLLKPVQLAQLSHCQFIYFDPHSHLESVQLGVSWARSSVTVRFHGHIPLKELIFLDTQKTATGKIGYAVYHYSCF